MMKTSLRFAALTAALSIAIWGGPVRSSHALQFSCNGSYPNPCEIGTTATCSDGDSIRSCECINFRGQGRWLCYW